MENIGVMAAQIKANIVALIDENKLSEAEGLLEQYISFIPEDAEAFSMQAVIFSSQGKMEQAKNSVRNGLKVDRNNFDLLYNLAYLLELQQDYFAALEIYWRLSGGIYSREQRAMVEDALARIAAQNPDISIDRKKMVFFVKPGMDSFIGNIMENLSGLCEIKKVVVTDMQQINQEMDWADLCWFDWCDDLVIHASNIKPKKKAKIICRLHSYEAFTVAPEHVNWDNVDSFIIDSQHIKKVVLPRIHIDSKKITMIPVGINENKFTFKNRQKGFNVAYVGYINFKKGPMLLIHLLEALVKKDKRYILHMCGQFQDYRYVMYFEQMIKELKLENNLRYNGRVESVDAWLDDKDYIVSTSLLEGQHITVMEAMCKGQKPIIHNFVGAKGLYKHEYVWNTIDEAVDMIHSEKYDSQEYRDFIVENYSNELEMKKIKQILKGLRS